MGLLTESHFDGIEPTSERLVHLTANRAKGPAKRPPSQVTLNNVSGFGFINPDLTKNWMCSLGILFICFEMYLILY